jgi:hypothetical protein
MINQKYIDLMNQEFDGVNSPEQSRELEDYLNGHEEARTYYRELALALDVFEKVAMLNPPGELGDDIMARVDDRAGNRRAAHPARGNRNLAAACRNLFRLRLQPAYAFTFIAGLVLGLALISGSDRFISGHGPEPSVYLSGTANHRSWDLERGSEASLAYPGLSGRYRTQRDGPDLRLHLELSSTQPAVIKFRHGFHTVLQHYSFDNPTPSTLTVSDSLIELGHQGDGSYDLVFRQDMDNQGPITMLVFSEGRLILTETLDE